VRDHNWITTYTTGKSDARTLGHEIALQRLGKTIAESTELVLVLLDELLIL
jgi:hypothetical protein